MNTKNGKAQETNETKSFQLAFTLSFKLDLQVGCCELAQRLPWRAEGSAWQEASKEGQCLALGSAGGRGLGKPQFNLSGI